MIATQPTKILEPFGPGVVTIKLFGRNGGETNWSMAGIRAHLDGHRNENWQRMDQIESACDLPMSRLYAPQPGEFNAEICDAAELTVVVWRIIEGAVSHDFMFRGVNAEGCNIPRRNAFWLSSADCYCIVARAQSGLTIACHAGLNSLVDRKYINEGVSGRRNPDRPSVVHALLERFHANGDDPTTIKFFLTCGIGPSDFRHNWSHPVDGPANRKLIEYLQTFYPLSVSGQPKEGRISLKELIRAQLRPFRVQRAQVTDDGIDTYNDRDAGEPIWHSYERAKTAVENLMRNGVMVINHQ